MLGFNTAILFLNFLFVYLFLYFLFFCFLLGYLGIFKKSILIHLPLFV